MAEERLRVGPEWADSGLVFVDPFGGPIDPDRVTDQLKVILEEAGLPSDRPVHKLRHSCASVLISQKARRARGEGGSGALPGLAHALGLCAPLPRGRPGGG